MPWLKQSSSGCTSTPISPSPTQMNHQMTFKNQHYVSVNHSERELLASGEYPLLNHVCREIQ